MKVLLEKRGGRLYPADTTAEEALQGLPDGAVMAEITRPRNPAFHRKAFSMLRFAYDNWEPKQLPDYRGQAVAKSFERFRHDITILAGYGRPVVNMRGDVRIEPESLSYASMSEDTFEAWYSATIDALLRTVFAGQQKAELEQRINEFMRFF